HTQEQPQQRLRVESRWLSTRPPRQGLRPRSLRVSQPAPSGDRRYLALALLGVSSFPTSAFPSSTTFPSSTSASFPSTALLSVSSSDASLQLLTWTLAPDNINGGGGSSSG
ncbi:hypothetical protein Agub_g14201, partial [Astrephomene gubernaculifera]